MTPQEVANKLVAYIRDNNYVDVYADLYHPDVISIEDPLQPDDMMQRKETKGMEAKLKNSQEWMDSIKEVHDDYTLDPVVVGNVIAIPMGMDVTMHDGSRMKLDEIAVYGVQDGKIIKEQFIY